MSKSKKLRIRNSTAEFLVFTLQAGEKGIEVRVEDETVWLTQKLIGGLFEVDVRTVSEHLHNIFAGGELTESATIRIFRTVQMEGRREVARDVAHYNLDAIIAVGYRVNSKRATQFRVWATGVLRDYLLRGYALNQKRLKELGQVVRILKRAEKQLDAPQVLAVVERYDTPLPRLAASVAALEAKVAGHLERMGFAVQMDHRETTMENGQ